MGPFWRKLSLALVLSFSVAGCATSPERLDGTPFEQAQYVEDEKVCRAQVSQRFPNVSRQKEFAGTPSRTPDTLPQTNPLPFAAQEFNRCMGEKGWKNF